jgi:hypothetical protein
MRHVLAGWIGSLVAGGALLVVTAPARADSLSLDLNDDAARVTFERPFAASKTRIDGSWLHHQERGDALSLGLHITGNAASQARPVNAGLGGRVYYVNADRADVDGVVLAVGGFVDGKLPNYDRIGFGAHVYFAPDVLAFGDASQFTDLSVHASYSVLRQGEVYLGLRNVQGEFDNRGDVTIDTGLMLGFRLNF